jgi:asparagine synthetase B (glutamine-hydrolysing)
MCGFAVSNINNLVFFNEKCKKRGPDKTTSVIINNLEFLHNLLHITGERTEQPFFKNDVACVFNGEIYNYKSFGDYKTDGDCIIDLYKNFGINYANQIDGEFVICLVDFLKNKIILSSDVFGCKPLWYKFQNGNFCVASYKSQIEKLGFCRIEKMPSNKTIVFDLKSLKKEKEIDNFIFDLKQYKKTFDDWLECFSQSVLKRTRNTNCEFFLGLSSGYDSGSIACELNKQKINFKSYSIMNNENNVILKARLETINNKDFFYLNKVDLNNSKKDLIENCENFYYCDYNLHENQANLGLNYICKKANLDKKKIMLSGQGADEIISDYGFNGSKKLKASCFGGLFPDDLSCIFPWCNFWEGTQITYLNAQEYVAGRHGLETRYPFLDKYLVQEFLNLSVDLKNSKYKSCVGEYLAQNNYPYEENKKRGFCVI